MEAALRQLQELPLGSQLQLNQQPGNLSQGRVQSLQLLRIKFGKMDLLERDLSQEMSL